MAELLIKRGSNNSYTEGDIVVSKSDEDIEWTWAQLLIRGTHGLEGVPFVSELFVKYYERIRIMPGTQTLIKNPVMNFREANAAGLGIQYERYVDKIKVQISNPVSTAVRNDIATYFGRISSQTALSDKSLFTTFSWGTEELKYFLTVFIPDSEFSGTAEIRGLMDSGYDKDGNVTYKRKFWVDFRGKYKAALGLDKSLRHAALSVSIPQKAKAWFVANLKGKSGLMLDSTFEEVLDAEVELPNRFFLGLTRGIIESK